MKTILVPTDFLECSEHALKHACILARKTKAKIIWLHVIFSEKNVSQFSTDGEWMGAWAGDKDSVEVPLMMRLLRQTKNKMNNLKRLSICSKVELQDVISMGGISERINAAVKKYDADIIVMGTHGAKGLNEVFAGSNAEHVVRDAEVPVLSIQNGKGRVQVKNIVFATDFSEETKFVVPFIKEFAGIFGAEIQLVKVISDSSFKARSLNH